MKSKKLPNKLNIKKQTIAALNPAEMLKQNGGLDTRVAQCSVETFCRTECMYSVCYTCILSC